MTEKQFNTFMKVLCLIAFTFLILALLRCNLFDDGIGCNYEYYFKHTERIGTFEDCFYTTRDIIKQFVVTERVQVPYTAYRTGKGNCKDECLLTAYWLFAELGIDSQLIGCKRIHDGAGHVILKVEDHYYEAKNPKIIDDKIGSYYKLDGHKLDYCEAIWEAQTCHCFYD